MTKRQKWILMILILGSITWYFLQNSPLFYEPPKDNSAAFVLQNKNN